MGEDRMPFARWFGVERHAGGDGPEWGEHPMVVEPSLVGGLGVRIRADVTVAPSIYVDQHRRQCGCGRWRALEPPAAGEGSAALTSTPATRRN